MKLNSDIEYTSTILIVDDEKSVLNSLKRLFRNEKYKVITALNGRQGLEILKSNNIQIVISDQRMPGMSGTEFLSEVKKESPDTIRIILSGYTDVDVVIDTINKGNIYKFFHKPWNDNSLILEIRQALEYYKLVKDNARLNFQNKALLLYHAVIDNISLPVVGINSEKIIAICNTRASGMQFDNINVQTGLSIADVFPPEIVNLVDNCLNSKESKTLKYRCCNKELYHITCTPFSGRFSKKGAVLSFMSANQIPPSHKNLTYCLYPGA